MFIVRLLNNFVYKASLANFTCFITFQTISLKIELTFLYIIIFRRHYITPENNAALEYILFLI